MDPCTWNLITWQQADRIALRQMDVASLLLSALIPLLIGETVWSPLNLLSNYGEYRDAQIEHHMRQTGPRLNYADLRLRRKRDGQSAL